MKYLLDNPLFFYQTKPGIRCTDREHVYSDRQVESEIFSSFVFPRIANYADADIQAENSPK